MPQKWSKDLSVTLRKEYSWEDGSKYGVVVMDRHDRTDSLKHKEIERLEIR